MLWGNRHGCGTMLVLTGVAVGVVERGKGWGAGGMGMQGRLVMQDRRGGMTAGPCWCLQVWLYGWSKREEGVKGKDFGTYYSSTTFFAPSPCLCEFLQLLPAKRCSRAQKTRSLPPTTKTPVPPPLALSVRIPAGITSEALLKSPENKIFPTYYTNTVGDLLTVKDKLSYCVIS